MRNLGSPPAKRRTRSPALLGTTTPGTYRESETLASNVSTDSRGKIEEVLFLKMLPGQNLIALQRRIGKSCA